MEVHQLLPLFLLHGVTLFCAVNGDNMMEEFLQDNHTFTPRPATLQTIMNAQCDNCPNKIVEDYMTRNTPVLHTDHTTQVPSPVPSSAEYVLIDVPGVCLRIRAIFILILKTDKMTNVMIPSPPITKAYGKCYDRAANILFQFPGGYLRLIFRKNKDDSSFYLGYIYVDFMEEDGTYIKEFVFLKSLVTPLGHYFTSMEVNFEVKPTVSVVLQDVKVQAFELDGGDFGRDKRWNLTFDDNPTTFVKYGKIRLLDELYSNSFRHWSVTSIVPWIYTIVFLVALPLNIMAIVMFLVKMRVRKPAVVYMLNLAAADVLLVSILPFYIVYRFLGSNWLIGEGMCRFVTASFYCNMYCSILLMTSISVDRFLAVVYPVRSLPWRTGNQAWLVCGVIWVISLASIVPLLIIEQTWPIPILGITTCHDIQEYEFNLDFYFYYFTTVISLFFFLPLFITVFCYIAIIRRLSRSTFDRTHKRSRAIRLTVVVLSVFVLCFGPTNVIYLIHYVVLYNSYDRSLFIPYTLCVSISSINCCLDPIIYYFASSQFQRNIYSLLRRNKNDCTTVKTKYTLRSKEQKAEGTNSTQLFESK